MTDIQGVHLVDDGVANLCIIWPEDMMKVLD